MDALNFGLSIHLMYAIRYLVEFRSFLYNKLKANPPSYNIKAGWLYGHKEVKMKVSFLLITTGEMIEICTLLCGALHMLLCHIPYNIAMYRKTQLLPCSIALNVFNLMSPGVTFYAIAIISETRNGITQGVMERKFTMVKKVLLLRSNVRPPTIHFA